jgi:hypothetical protein
MLSACERMLMNSTGASAGFTLRYAGSCVISGGRARCARSSAACTSTAAASMSRFSSNSSVTLVLPSVLVLLMTGQPGDGLELLFQRQRHRGGHVLGAGAGQLTQRR